MGYNATMTDSSIQEARELIKSRPYLMWSTKNYSELSPESILENVISYGDWTDFKQLVKIFGIKQCAKLFTSKIINKQRTNLKPQTVNYFTKYFQKNA